MRTKPIAITELPSSPDAERRSRMIRYSVAMGIRMACILVVIIVPGWWRLLPAIGAIVLPYFAVVIANNAQRRITGSVERPGSVVAVDRATGTTAPPVAPSSGEDAA